MDQVSCVRIIAAIGRRRELGRNGKIPWNIKEDLKRFKEWTMGGSIIMGRKTFESIGKPLPGRENIVITRNPSWKAAGIQTAHSLDESLQIAKNTPWIIGGAEIYSLGLPLAEELWLTEINEIFQADVFFPNWDRKNWQLFHKESCKKDDEHNFSWQYARYKRIKNQPEIKK